MLISIENANATPGLDEVGALLITAKRASMHAHTMAHLVGGYLFLTSTRVLCHVCICVCVCVYRC